MRHNRRIPELAAFILRLAAVQLLRWNRDVRYEVARIALQSDEETAVEILQLAEHKVATLEPAEDLPLLIELLEAAYRDLLAGLPLEQVKRGLRRDG